MSDTRVDLYLEWEQALNEPEVDSTVVAGLETKARDMGIDLWQINNIMLNGLTAASFDPNLHPRGRDGKFIDVFGFVRLFDFVDRKGERHSEASGRVKSIKPDDRNPGSPDVEVTLDDGSSVVVKPSQVATAPRSKARIRLETTEGDTSPAAEARRSIDQLLAEDPPLSDRQIQEFEGRRDPEAMYEKAKNRIDAALNANYGEPPDDAQIEEWATELTRLQREAGGAGGDRPFRNLSDNELQQQYQTTVDRLLGDIDDPQLEESLGLDVEYFREEFEARGLARLPGDGPVSEADDERMARELGIPRAVSDQLRRDRPFRDLSDDELRQTYQNTVDASLGDIDPQLVDSLGLDAEYLREEMAARGLPRGGTPERRPPGPRAFGEEGDLEPAFESGVPTSIRDAYFAYQAAERDRGVQDRDLLDLDDWVESGSPAGGAQAPEQPGPVREKFERTNYVESRDVGNLMVGDEIILPGDMPGVVESFEFPGDRPDSVIVHTDNGTYHGKTGDVLPSYRDGDNDINQIGEPVTVEPGELGSKDNPIKTSDPLEAVTALHEGKYVELETVDQVSTLLDELARIANEAKEAGEKAPNYDLCLVSVPGTNLFCAESKGIPRIEMPQLGGVPTPGSRADALPKNDAGEVDIGPAFVRHLREKGVNVEESRKMASHLKASQSELVGTKVGGMMKWMEGGTDLANNTIRESSIFVTRDGYVVDGHHRWAAVVGLDAQEGGLDELDMPVREIDMDILDVLKEANDFAIDFGVPPKGTGAPGAAPGVAV
jgi:hypothetical protein